MMIGVSYVVVMANGRAIEFTADEVTEVMGEYIFSCEGEVVAIFRKEAIAGYIRHEDEEDEDA